MRHGSRLLTGIAHDGEPGSGIVPRSGSPDPRDVLDQVVDLLRAAAVLHEHDGRSDIAAAHRKKAAALDQLLHS